MGRGWASGTWGWRVVDGEAVGADQEDIVVVLLGLGSNSVGGGGHGGRVAKETKAPESEGEVGGAVEAALAGAPAARVGLYTFGLGGRVLGNGSIEGESECEEGRQI